MIDNLKKSVSWVALFMLGAFAGSFALALRFIYGIYGYGELWLYCYGSLLLSSFCAIPILLKPCRRCVVVSSILYFILYGVLCVRSGGELLPYVIYFGFPILFLVSYAFIIKRMDAFDRWLALGVSLLMPVSLLLGWFNDKFFYLFLFIPVIYVIILSRYNRPIKDNLFALHMIVFGGLYMQVALPIFFILIYNFFGNNVYVALTPFEISDIEHYAFMRPIAMVAVWLIAAYGITLVYRFMKSRSPRLLLLAFINAGVMHLWISQYFPGYGIGEFVFVGIPSYTYYSAGFSFKNFAKVKEGMTRAEVEALIGKGFENDYFDTRSSHVYKGTKIVFKSKSNIRYASEAMRNMKEIICYTYPSWLCEDEWRCLVYYEDDIVAGKYLKYWWD